MTDNKCGINQSINHESQSPTNPAPNNEGWKTLERRQKPTKPKSTKVKLVIRGVEMGDVLLTKSRQS
jgi:hypothetical protein